MKETSTKSTLEHLSHSAMNIPIVNIRDEIKTAIDTFGLKKENQPNLTDDTFEAVVSYAIRLGHKLARHAVADLIDEKIARLSEGDEEPKETVRPSPTFDTYPQHSFEFNGVSIPTSIDQEDMPPGFYMMTVREFNGSRESLPDAIFDHLCRLYPTQDSLLVFAHSVGPNGSLLAIIPDKFMGRDTQIRAALAVSYALAQPDMADYVLGSFKSIGVETDVSRKAQELGWAIPGFPDAAKPNEAWEEETKITMESPIPLVTGEVCHKEGYGPLSIGMMNWVSDNFQAKVAVAQNPLRRYAVIVCLFHETLIPLHPQWKIEELPVIGLTSLDEFDVDQVEAFAMIRKHRYNGWSPSAKYRITLEAYSATEAMLQVETTLDSIITDHYARYDSGPVRNFIIFTIHPAHAQKLNPSLQLTDKETND